MHLLYIGDVMGEPGIETVAAVLPALKQQEHIDVVIAQAENVTRGRGLSVEDYKRLREVGIDGFTGGNHTVALPETAALLNDPNVPVTGPANMLGCPGPGFKYMSTPKGKVLIISLLGKIVGRDAEKEVDNPLQKIDAILEAEKDVPRTATIVNFHGDFSSEKVIVGHYLSGRVSAVIGDHWHVPTADAQVLPGGTAHQTDVGMCGSLDSSLGVTFASVIPRWRDGVQTRNVLETEGRRQFNALLVTIDEKSGLATAVRPVQQILEA